ncbi:hypothetical protein ACR6C2_15060 [Streptomyces sp. INA 01156]
MGDELFELLDNSTLEGILAWKGVASPDDFRRAYDDWLLGATAILLHQQGHPGAADLLADVVTLDLIHTETDWGTDYYEAVLQVEPHLVPASRKRSCPSFVPRCARR